MHLLLINNSNLWIGIRHDSHSLHQMFAMLCPSEPRFIALEILRMSFEAALELHIFFNFYSLNLYLLQNALTFHNIFCISDYIFRLICALEILDLIDLFQLILEEINLLSLYGILAVIYSKNFFLYELLSFLREIFEVLFIKDF